MMDTDLRIDTKKKVPSLRFAGFDEEWEEKKLGEVFSFRTTNSFSRECLSHESGEVKNIHYGDIHTKFRSLFDITKEAVPFINKDIPIQKIPVDTFCKEGDLIIADASEDYEDIGKCIEIVNLNNERVLAGLHTLQARPDLHEMYIGFSGQMVKSNNIRRQIEKIAQGSKVLSISTGRLAQINISFPALPEQQKIASFLTAVDEKLQALKQQKNLLEQYKKGMMQKIISQEIRFKDDEGKEFGEWETRKACAVFKNHTNKNHNGDLPILAVTQNKGAILRDNLDMKIISSEVSIKSYKIVEAGDFIISLRSFQGGIEYSNVFGICSPVYTVLKPKIEINNLFFREYLKKSDFIQQLNGTVEGIRDGKQISYNAFSTLDLTFPTLPEQTKIANFLSAIDEKISHCQVQITKMEQYKKGLLQQLFV